jgi:hypothetical protein
MNGILPELFIPFNRDGELFFAFVSEWSCFFGKDLPYITDDGQKILRKLLEEKYSGVDIFKEKKRPGIHVKYKAMPGLCGCFI